MSEWKRVTTAEPCKVCKKPDWCSVGEKVVHCMRVESEKPVKSGGWLHFLDSMPIVAPPPRKKRPLPAQDFEMVADFCQRAAEKYYHLPELSEQLGVSVAAMQDLCVGYSPQRQCWTFPEYDDIGRVIGINLRYPTGKKLMMKGSHRGIYLPRSFAKWDRDKPIYLPEGGSDTAALLTCGLYAVGRPSNIGGIHLLVHLLALWRGKVVVVGENDRRATEGPHKCQGCPQCWPGGYGARSTAIAIAGEIGGSVKVVYPPKPFKDVREWLKSGEKMAFV